MKLLIISLALCTCNMAIPIEPSTTSLLELLNNSGFSELKDALVKHNMTNIINATEPMTIFAPSNEAFKNLKNNPWTKNMTHGMMEKLMGRLVVLRRKLLPADVRNEMIVDTVSNEKLRLNVYPKVRTVNGIMVVMEPNVQNQQVIIYRVNRFPMAPPTGRDIFEMLNRRKERFSTLVKAIEVANLKDTLKTAGPYTLFAPNNDAFKALPEAKLAKLMESPAELKSILLGHVINGTYFLGALLDAPELPALAGGLNKIAVNGMNMTVNGTKVFTREGMIAENGAIHVIDRVLLPSNTTAPPSV
ncbi:transforming growth factor-beta-induced protein ig-h3-like [Daphnia carinata]|uniref:transforming growth factor-beta-induced protein ig-h3-like n=1 Tax=Daphnia carinata TaxID=120202 RepID=UPI00257D0AF5|nr:transforming growth factor-beta-induced protein ig-h3-like [Daphnia carinata]